MPLAAARQFLEGLDPQARLVIYADFDADGTSAAALLCRGLEALGRPEPIVHLKSRYAPAWSEAAKAALRALEPDALVVTDLGVQDPGLLPEVPTLYLDHHVPLGIPGPPHVVCVAHDWDPIPCSAWLAYDLVRPWLESPESILWVAAVGVLSDLGDKAPWPEMAAFRERFRITHVRKAVTLCNAARRASTAIPEVPFGVLRHGSEPKDMQRGEAGTRLSDARHEIQSAMKKARMQRPIFASSGPWVHIPVDDRCQVHPLIAQQWAQRLPKYIGLSSNAGYLPDAVAFSIRTRVDTDVPSILRAMPFASDHRDTFGHGHRRASGGQLPEALMSGFLEALEIPV